MKTLRHKLNLVPQGGGLAARHRLLGVLLGLSVATAHAMLGVLLPGQGPQTGFLLAFYATGVAQRSTGLNFQYLQYAVLTLTALFTFYELRAALRDRCFPVEYTEGFLKQGSGWQVARAYYGLAFVSLLLFMLAFSDAAGHSTRYDTIAKSHLGSAMFVSATAYLAFLVLCHFGWMAVYLIHPSRRQARTQSS